MVAGIVVDIVIVVLAIIIAFILYKSLKSIKTLVFNILIGFLLIIVSNWLIPGVNVPLWNLVTIIATALTGVLGAAVLIILNFFGLFPL
jgi:SigmaK-factor processing regulatory protein BofA.